MFKEVDHIAIVVRDTEEALTFYRDRLKLPVLLSEVLEGPGVRLTHLDMGNVRLQLVEPLTEAHPLRKDLAERGEGFHHVCWKVADVDAAMSELAEQGLHTKPGSPMRRRPAVALFCRALGNARSSLGDDRTLNGGMECMERARAE